MAATDILVKSAKGEAEIKAKARSISMKHRSLLVMINGKLKEADYLDRFKAMGDIPALIQDLEKNGYIERMPGEAAPAKLITEDTHTLNLEARQYMAEFMYELMGPDGESLAVRLEHCKDNKQLAEMVEVCVETINRIGKPKKAEEFSNIVKNLLA